MLRTLFGKVAPLAAPAVRSMPVSAAMSTLSRPLQQAKVPSASSLLSCAPVFAATSAAALRVSVDTSRCFATAAAAGPSALDAMNTGYDLSIAERMKMAEKIKRPKPTTPGKRHLISLDRSDLWPGRPFMPLTEAMRSQAGRNNHGRITVRYRGGGVRRRYRLVDFRRMITDVPGVVRRLEHDPNRNAHIALVQYPDRRMQYILAPQGLNPGDRVTTSRSNTIEIKPGNAMRLRDIPIGATISCIELQPGHGAQYMRSAGTSAQLLEKTNTGRRNHALVRIQSKEVRLVPLDSLATIGVMSNALHRIRSYGKAGRIRWMGRRGLNRGLARNPVDHPHGGGAGAGRPGRPSCSPTAILAKGFKTRSVRKNNPNIVAMRGGVKVRRG